MQYFKRTTRVTFAKGPNTILNRMYLIKTCDYERFGKLIKEAYELGKKYHEPTYTVIKEEKMGRIRSLIKYIKEEIL